MTVTDKVKELQKKRKEILKKAQKATTKKPLSDKIRSYTGKFHAVVGPMLKEAKEIQNAIVLFSK